MIAGVITGVIAGVIAGVTIAGDITKNYNFTNLLKILYKSLDFKIYL